MFLSKMEWLCSSAPFFTRRFLFLKSCTPFLDVCLLLAPVMASFSGSITLVV
jgi:hypothetical protein